MNEKKEYRITARAWAHRMTTTTEGRPAPKGYESWDAFDAEWAPKFPGFEFGEDDQIRFLTDTEVVAAIMKWGRASITERDNGVRFLTFENDYD